MRERRSAQSWTMAAAVMVAVAIPATARAQLIAPAPGVDVQAVAPISATPLPAPATPTTRTAAVTLRISGKLKPKRRPARVRSKARRRALARLRARSAASCVPGPTMNCAGLPLNFADNNDCTGDVVYITGFYHLLVQTTTSGDGTIRTKAYTNFQNSSGVAVPSGLKYQANLTEHTYERVDPFPGEVDMEVRDNYELISQGPSANMIVRFRFRMHVDALGFPTVSVSGTEARCSR